MRIPRVSDLLIPLQFGLRVLFYVSALALGVLATYFIVEFSRHLIDLLDKTLFSEPWDFNWNNYR